MPGRACPLRAAVTKNLHWPGRCSSRFVRRRACIPRGQDVGTGAPPAQAAQQKDRPRAAYRQAEALRCEPRVQVQSCRCGGTENLSERTGQDCVPVASNSSHDAATCCLLQSKPNYSRTSCRSAGCDDTRVARHGRSLRERQRERTNHDYHLASAQRHCLCYSRGAPVHACASDG